MSLLLMDLTEVNEMKRYTASGGCKRSEATDALMLAWST